MATQFTQDSAAVAALVTRNTQRVSDAEGTSRVLQNEVDTMLQQFKGQAAGATHQVHQHVQQHLRNILRDMAEMNQSIQSGKNLQDALDSQTQSSIMQVTAGLPGM